MKLKNIIVAIICSILIIVVCIYNKDIVNSIVPLLDVQPTIVIKEGNEYKKSHGYKYIDLTNEYVPYGYQDMLNIIYSVLNNGWDSFTFYCPSEYEHCLDDLVTISSDNTLLTNINNYVHPFNNFESIKTTHSETGEVNLTIIKLYTNEEIGIINNKINEISASILNDTMSIEDKIKTVHDYIINNSKYDVEKIDSGKSLYQSDTAYGPLIEGHGTCSGYSDAMAIFLNRFGVNNFKIASDKHVWNAVYLNNTWKHLDVTWDDPVSSDGTEYVLYKFYLIDTPTLMAEDTTNHEFNSSVYLEFK